MTRSQAAIPTRTVLVADLMLDLREKEREYFPFQIFAPVLPGEYEDDETVEDESDEDQLR